METNEPMNETKSETEFSPITTTSGMTLSTAREEELWRDGYEEGMVTAEENSDEDYELGDYSGFLPPSKEVYLVVSKVRSMLPDFKLPTRRNGENLIPASVTVRGRFVIVRYFRVEAVEGPTADAFFLDVFYNSDGSEVFRAHSSIIEPPPAPPAFLQRLRFAIYVLIGAPQYATETAGQIVNRLTG
jgi:hypothetical protein